MAEGRRLTREEVNNKHQLIARLNAEMTEYTGRLLNEEEGLRVRALGEEIDALEAEVLEYDLEDMYSDVSWWETGGEANFWRRG